MVRTILAILYGSGCVIALLCGLCEIYKIENSNDTQLKREAEYGMLIPYVLLSWFTVYAKIKNFKKTS